MKRWKMSELQGIDDLQFAISVLSERKADLNPFTPLAVKLTDAIHTLEELREEKKTSSPKEESCIRIPLFCIDGTSGKKIDGSCTVNLQSKEVMEVSLNDGSEASRQYEILSSMKKGEIPWNAMFLTLGDKLHSISFDQRNGEMYYI